MPTPDTTHRACPVDGMTCWKERARDECPHIRDDGVRECVRQMMDKLMNKHADLWAAMAKE